MIKKLLITTIAGTAVYFLFGWFIFEFILGNYTTEHTIQISGFKKTDAQSSLPLLIVSCAAYSALISFVLVYLLNIKALFKAFKIAATIGILVAIMADTYWYATSNFYSNVAVVAFDILGAGISVGILGLTIGFINKKQD